MSQQEAKNMAKYFYRASSSDFMKISGAPIAYWASDQLLSVFAENQPLRSVAKPVQGLITGDTERFARLWFEVDRSKTAYHCATTEDAEKSNKKWFPYNKGGDYRKWYGNYEYVVNWENNGYELKNFKSENGKLLSRPQNESTYFREGLTWTAISSSYFAVRYCPPGSIGSNAGMMIFSTDKVEMISLISLLNSALVNHLISCLTQTLNFDQGIISRIPVQKHFKGTYAHRLIEIHKRDWDSSETSWDFEKLCLLECEHESATLREAYLANRRRWSGIVDEAQRLEVLNNQELISAFNLQEEVSPVTELESITLSCNPYHKYGRTRGDKNYESALQADSVRDIVSYAVGCIMGRYSLDAPGLILANQGEDLNDYLDRVQSTRFIPDDDAILPLTDQEWFSDDSTNRLCEFVQVAWGKEHLQENLDFVAESLCLHSIKSKQGESARDTIRRYLSTQFFKDHLRTYKKRPIYWLFSSGKHKAFECLVYLHRYNEGTLARMRTEYVIPLSAKLNAYAEKLEQDKEASTSAADTKRLEKEIATLHKQQSELAEFDEKLRHYADQRISLDLDDGVKVNYGKFGDLLAEVKAVTGQK